MKRFFNDTFGEAARLTQGRNLQAATELIQRTLRESGMPAFAAAARTDATGGEVIDAESRVLPEAAPPTAGAPQGDTPAEQWRDGSVSHQGRQLHYKLYLPPRPAGDHTPPPLLLMLHGCTQDPDDFAAGTRMNALAREAGMLVLYPAQTQHANSHRCWNWFKTQHQQRDRGEPALLAALTRQVMAEHGVDASRVYVAGLSAGGAMADILGRTYPDLFAAVGVHSGLPLGAAADLPSALGAMRSGAPAAPNANAGARPVIVFHGDADATVHPANGNAVAEAARAALGRPPAETVSGSAPGGQRFTHTVYRGADGRSTVEHWQLHGTGHAWSGGSPAGSYTAPGGVDASAEMLRFFGAHRLAPSAGQRQ